MARCYSEERESGLRVIHLENDLLRVSLVPAAAGKLTTMIDKRSGRNWLWSNPHIPLTVPEYGSDFGRDLDSGGWDEILFSVDPCVVDVEHGAKISVPDHGDLACQPWELDDFGETAGGHATCVLSARGRAVPYDWQRVVTLGSNDASLTFDYTLTNTGDMGWPFYWCAHPLLAADAGTRIVIPECEVFNVDKMSAEGVEGVAFDWPNLPLPEGRVADLGNSFADSSAFAGNAAKIFVRSPSGGGVSVATNENRERLTFDYDQTSAPWLGIWINNGGWSGSGSEPYVNLGIEPATAPHDDLRDAMRDGRSSLLQAGETRRWSLKVFSEVTL